MIDVNCTYGFFAPVPAFWYLLTTASQELDTFGLINLVKEQTWFFNGHKSAIDVILTNRGNKFYVARCYELGDSDCHKMIVAILRSHIPRIQNKNIFYRSFKNFNKNMFLKELKQILHTKFDISVTNSSYENIIEIIVSLLDKFSPMKKNTIRSNHSCFMNR